MSTTFSPTQLITQQDPSQSSPIPKPKFENSPRPYRHDEILARFTELFPDLDSRLAESILKTVYVARDRLPEGYTETIKGSDLFPHVILVDRQYFQIVTGHVGTGGNGAVVKGPVIPFDTAPQIEASPSKKAKTRVRKTGHNPQAPSFSPVKTVTQDIHEKMTPSKRKGFARFLTTSRSLRGNPMALMPYYEGKNFAEAIFRDATHLISSFGQVARILSGIHEQGKVHRDFKALNVMLTKSGPVIVDPDGIKATYTAASRTHGTPEYLNPRAFGSERETLINQRKRWGLQRPCDDMYAFAIAGLNTLRRHLALIVPKSQDNVHAAINTLKPRYYIPKNLKLRFTDEQLRAYGEKYGYRAFFWDRVRNPRTGETMPERIGVYPLLEEYRALIDTIFSKAFIPVDEAKLLENFASLCVTLKHLPDQDRHDGLSTQNQCIMILSQKENTTNPATSSSTNKKRRREEYEPCALSLQDCREQVTQPLPHFATYSV